MDRNSANMNAENAAWLCLEHHEQYDSSSRQAKGYTQDELRVYQQKLREHLGSPLAWPDLGKSPTVRRTRRGVSLEVYDRRAPTYRRTIEFVRYAMKDLNPTLDEILKFAADTDEALFLFDASIADYLAEIFRRAVRLNTIAFIHEGGGLNEGPSLLDERTELIVWFSEQLQEIRSRFAPFLQLA